MKKVFIGCLIGALLASSVIAQTVVGGRENGSVTGAIHPLSTDLAGQLREAPYVSSIPVTVGASALVTAGRVVVTTCTVAGNVAIVHKDTTTVTVAVAVGTSYWPEAAVQIATSGTTATCTYWIQS